MTGDNTYTYGYNAESEIKSAAGVNYTYDGDGNRLEKSSGKIYWYGAGTEILDESDGSGNFTNEYVFFGGKRIAMRTVSTGTIYYYEEDMLGSSRTMVQAGQTSPCFDADFLPFGYEKDVTTTCTQNYKFEGKERDTETNNDDFGARYYTFRLGRWLSADWSAVPAPVPYANLTNPQTLNLYAMVSNNPESFADLNGHCGVNQLMGPMGSGCQPLPTNGQHNPTESPCVKNGEGNCPNETTAGATTQPEDQSKANQNKQKKANDHAPYTIRQKEVKRLPNGSLKVTYQVVDSQGKPVRNVSVQEHVEVKLALNAEAVQNPSPVKTPSGEFLDRVGSEYPSGKGNSLLQTEQTFSVTKDGKTYYPTTKIDQYSLVKNEKTTAAAVVAVP